MLWQACVLIPPSSLCTSHKLLCPSPSLLLQASDGSGFVPLGWAPPGAGPATPPLSWEGGPQRCFRRLFVCHRGINITSWPLHGLGQQLVAHYRGSTKLAEVEAAVAAAAPPEQAGPAGGEAEAEAPPAGGVQRNTASSGAVLPTNSSAGSERVLRVIFHRRRSPDRQLLNAGELVEQCNRWRHTTAGGERLRGRCWEVEPADLFSGMAAAQQADVFVGVHGERLPSLGCACQGKWELFQ